MDCDYDINKFDHNEDSLERDEEEFFEIVTCATAAIREYYVSYIHKEPCMVSFQTGMKWLLELMHGHDKRILNMFRMRKDVVIDLSSNLQVNYGLKGSRNMSGFQKVCICLYILSQGASNRHTQERFQHSGETISRVFREVLDTICLLAKNLIKPANSKFRDIPQEIRQDNRYMPYFKDCIGAIDVTHVQARISPKKQIPFIGRKGIPTQNIMAACSFDMCFTFVLAGWKGTAHDTHIFYHAINNDKLNFPKPPSGKYYLVDVGHPQIKGHLRPYKGVRYHQPDFCRGGPAKGREEIFNRAHSSLRSCIERTFGVWKQRWKILRDMPSFPFGTQRNIVIATMALHNYIRRNASNDPAFTKLDEDPDFVPVDFFPDADEAFSQEQVISRRTTEMDSIRNQIALSLMAKKN